MAQATPVLPDVDQETRDEIEQAGRCKCTYGDNPMRCMVRCKNQMTGEDRMCTTCRRFLSGELQPDGHCHAVIRGMG
jgi:hypothetical protein